ncbi:UNKNOWN [Stylonychia lemnae]|uniref:Kelch motif family protein n=1 Tax=Stylonychia lemnae TaxID=5949 RepID=A0A077ZZU0_STYLE|nr:UNKNOWN [Stylonychia lemnae]|eukprot:CDW74038.1 UNKNOWN [Stylonychia lemnae]
MNKSVVVARHSYAIFSILQFLRPSLRTRLQLLCKYFYDKIIPELVFSFPILESNKDDYFELFKDQKVIRINQSSGQTILYSQQIRQLVNTSLSPQNQIVQQWNNTKLEVPAGFQFEKIIFVDYQYYLFNSTPTAMKVYKLIGNKIVQVNEAKMVKTIQSCYVAVQNRYILRIGGYQSLLDEKKSKQMVFSMRIAPKSNTQYDNIIKIFDIVTNQWINTNKFGQLSNIRHGCSASVHNKNLYVFGGSYFIQSGNRINVLAHQPTIEKQDLLNPQQQFQVIDFKMKIPMETLFSCQHLAQDHFFIFGQIESKANATKTKQSKLICNFYRYNVSSHQYQKKKQGKVEDKILDQLQTQGLEKQKQNTNFQDIKAYNGIHVITNDFGAVVFQDKELLNHEKYILSWKIGYDAVKQPDPPKPKLLKPSVNDQAKIGQNLNKRPQTALPIRKTNLAQRPQSAVTRPVVSRRLVQGIINQR